MFKPPPKNNSDTQRIQTSTIFNGIHLSNTIQLNKEPKNIESDPKDHTVQAKPPQ